MARPKQNQRKTAPRKETVKKVSKASLKAQQIVNAVPAVENSSPEPERDSLTSTEPAAPKPAAEPKSRLSIEHCKSW
jgi:hypothetical protein